MELKCISFTVDQGIAWLTLRRPARANAWTGRMHHEYRWALTEAEADRSVRVVVVTGGPVEATRPMFCPGADATALAGHAERGAYDDGLRGTEPPMPPVDEPFAEDFAFQLAMATPIIAAVNGAAAGVGLVIACYADIRIGVAGAKLTTAAPKLGFPAEYGLGWLLPRLVGASRASDWLLTGRKFSTEEGLAAGLFSQVAPEDLFAATVQSAAEDLARHVSPASVAATKQQIWTETLGCTPAEAVARSKHLLATMTQGPDFREGTRALNEGRPPTF